MAMAEPTVAPSLAEGNWKGITGFMKLRGKACSERLLLLGTRPETAAFIPSSNLLPGNGWNKAFYRSACCPKESILYFTL